MIKLPKITTKIVNESLAPYFEQVLREIQQLAGIQRETRIKQYSAYLESEAQKVDSKTVRIQIRINLHALLEKVGVLETPQIEINVRPNPHPAPRPRFGNEAYYELFHNSK